MDSVAKPTVAILYGTGEGKKIGKRLCRSLAARGFVCTDNPVTADAIIAHSGGTLLLPPQTAAKAILIVGPITGFRGSLLGTTVKKVRQDWQQARASKSTAHFLRKSMYNARYLLTRPAHHGRMLRGLASGRKLLPSLTTPNVGVIALRNDPWSGFLAELAPHDRHSYTFLHYNKLHDDLWENPHDYITVLEYLYAK
ncbi:MAG TPA: hypothetical protein VF733_01075 [Candidatus Saccharimonadales bacterium]